ncbi:hypothetical protein D3C76_1361130 [compost metagenome]
MDFWSPSPSEAMVTTIPSTAATIPKPGMPSAMPVTAWDGCSSSSFMLSSSMSNKPSSSCGAMLPVDMMRK